MTWEYLTASYEPRSSLSSHPGMLLVDWLNGYGADGWEVVSCSQTPGSNVAHYTFKRQGGQR